MNRVCILPLGHSLCYYFNRVLDIIQHVQILFPPKEKPYDYIHEGIASHVPIQPTPQK
jgi:hypothetical protein